MNLGIALGLGAQLVASEGPPPATGVFEAGVFEEGVFE